MKPYTVTQFIIYYNNQNSVHSYPMMCQAASCCTYFNQEPKSLNNGRQAPPSDFWDHSFFLSQSSSLCAETQRSMQQMLAGRTGAS